MLKKFFTTIAAGLAFGCTFWACERGSATIPQPEEEKEKIAPVAVDYTLGRTMNAILGRGINLGNSWDSRGSDDGGWGNPIEDSDFAIIKAAGFNSVRIPVRWQQTSDYTTHTVDPDRLNGVLRHIRLAIANGLAVVVNFHHYDELSCYGGGMPPSYQSNNPPPPDDNPRCKYMPEKFQAEKAHFLAMWNQVATAMGEFADNQVVLEIWNEPAIPNSELVNEVMIDAYNVIRTAAPGKTIMFESYHLAKFEDLGSLHLPQDGNIIFSGHYYQPYTYTHQGQHGNKCLGDAAFANTASSDMASYAALARRLYPDVNGVDHVPLNMGEFGVAGGNDMWTCTWYDKNGNPVQGDWPSDQNKARWAMQTAQAAISNGISFHYWGFDHVGGFEAYDGSNWYPGFPDALLK